MDITMHNINVTLPVSDVRFFKELVKKMGWTINPESSANKAYEQSMDDLAHGRVCEYSSLDEFIKEIEEDEL